MNNREDVQRETVERLEKPGEWERLIAEAVRVQRMVLEGYTRVWKTEVESPISQGAGVSSVGMLESRGEEW